jgi:hypothetical protein
MATFGQGGTRSLGTSCSGIFLDVGRGYEHTWNAGSYMRFLEQKKTCGIGNGRSYREPKSSGSRRQREREFEDISVERCTSDQRVQGGIESSRVLPQCHEQLSRLVASNIVRSNSPQESSPPYCSPKKQDRFIRRPHPQSKCSKSPNDCDDLRPKLSSNVRLDYFHPLSLTSSHPENSTTNDPSRVVVAHKRLVHLEIRKLARRAKLTSTSLQMQQLLKPTLARCNKPPFPPMNSTDDVNSLQLCLTTKDLLIRARELLRARRAIPPHQQHHEQKQFIGRLATESSTSLAGFPEEIPHHRHCSQPLIENEKSTWHSSSIMMEVKNCLSPAVHAGATTAEDMGETEGPLHICDESPMEEQTDPQSPDLEFSLETFSCSREQCSLSDVCQTISQLQLESAVTPNLPSLKRTLSSNASSISSVEQIEKNMLQIQNLGGEETFPEFVFSEESSSEDVFPLPGETYSDDQCVSRSVHKNANIIIMMHTQVENNDEEHKLMEAKVNSKPHRTDPSISGSSVHCSDGVSSEVILSSPSSAKWNPLNAISKHTSIGNNRRQLISSDTSAPLPHAVCTDYSITTATKTSASSRPTEGQASVPSKVNYKKGGSISFVTKGILRWFRRGKAKEMDDDWYVAKHVAGDAKENVMAMVFFD